MHACMHVHIGFSISDLYDSAEGVILRTQLVATTQEMHQDRDHGFEERFKVNIIRIKKINNAVPSTQDQLTPTIRYIEEIQSSLI